MSDFAKKRIVVKIGSSSLFHVETGKHDFVKIEKLVRMLADLQNQGKDVILVSSGAISTGRNMLSLSPDNMSKAVRQACASVGQAQLISIYQKRGIKRAETGPTLEENIMALSQWKPFNPQIIKRRRCYTKELSSY